LERTLFLYFIFFLCLEGDGVNDGVNEPLKDPGCQCPRREVDVGAEVFFTNEALKIEFRTKR
jgi:hypothetical protein